MITIAIVRISEARIFHTKIDIVWEIFWLEVEATIAVTMVSITAFRSLLGLEDLKLREEKNRAWYWYRQKYQPRNVNIHFPSDSNVDRLSSLPGAKLTGIRTFIWGNHDSRINETNPMSSSKDRMQVENQIIITQKISSESETVRPSTQFHQAP